MSLSLPPNLRAPTCYMRLTVSRYANACWVLGQLIASIVMRGMITNATTWSYRIPFALQWIFPIPIFFAVYFAPESPWWLIRQDRCMDAMKTLRRLRTKPATMSHDEFDKTLTGAMETMIQTNEREQQMQSGTSYKDCLKGVDRRRTEITCMVWIIQTLCGSTFMGFSTYFCESLNLHMVSHGPLLLTLSRRTSWSRLLSCFYPLTRPICSRSRRRFRFLGLDGTLWAAHTLRLRPSHDLRLCAAYRHTSLHTATSQLCRRSFSCSGHLRSRERAPYSAQLVYRSATTRIHTSL